jgi:hypothetical protein
MERPSETALAHVVLLRCAMKGSESDAQRHRKALQNVNITQIAAFVRREVEGVNRGIRAG